MPQLDWNKTTWDGIYNWAELGEEWSALWKNSETQWFGCIYPRIHRFLPAKNILEIAPGHGRWTRFLLPNSENYWGVDYSEVCVNYCKEHYPEGNFYVNDGISLDSIADESIDFCFSFDSLVHCSVDVFHNYVPQILKKLTCNGVAFIHHSNLGSSSYMKGYKNEHNRDLNMSSNLIKYIINSNGGTTLIQENLNWGTDNLLIDTLTTFSKANDVNRLHDTIILDNENFMLEAFNCYNYISAYSQNIIKDRNCKS